MKKCKATKALESMFSVSKNNGKSKDEVLHKNMLS